MKTVLSKSVIISISLLLVQGCTQPPVQVPPTLNPATPILNKKSMLTVINKYWPNKGDIISKDHIFRAEKLTTDCTIENVNSIEKNYIAFFFKNKKTTGIGFLSQTRTPTFIRLLLSDYYIPIKQRSKRRLLNAATGETIINDGVTKKPTINIKLNEHCQAHYLLHNNYLLKLDLKENFPKKIINFYRINVKLQEKTIQTGEYKWDMVDNP